MIEINLLPGKKKGRAAPGAGFKLRLPDIRGLVASIKNPWLLGASAATVVIGGGSLLLFITLTTQRKVLDSRLQGVQIEKRRFDVVIAQKRQSERIRDSLVAEINIIRGIDADRYVWPHILDQITKALPPYTWLTSVTVGGGAPTGPISPNAATDSAGALAVRVWVTGSTVDIQAYTTFLRQLAASPWFTDVTPATSSTVIEADRPVTAFNLSFRYKIADSVYIRTVTMTPLVR